MSNWKSSHTMLRRCCRRLASTIAWLRFARPIWAFHPLKHMTLKCGCRDSGCSARFLLARISRHSRRGGRIFAIGRGGKKKMKFWIPLKAGGLASGGEKGKRRGGGKGGERW